MGNIADYYRERAAEVEEAKKPSPPTVALPAREWSEAVRIVRMGIVPPGEFATEEVEEWITFCDTQGRHEQAAVARGVLEQATRSKR